MSFVFIEVSLFLGAQDDHRVAELMDRLAEFAGIIADNSRGVWIKRDDHVALLAAFAASVAIHILENRFERYLRIQLGQRVEVDHNLLLVLSVVCT